MTRFGGWAQAVTAACFMRAGPPAENGELLCPALLVTDAARHVQHPGALSSSAYWHSFCTTVTCKDCLKTFCPSQGRIPGIEAGREENMTAGKENPVESEVRVAAGPVTLEGNLVVPDKAAGIVLFAHGSGSSRHSPRNRYVADKLHQTGLATLLFDLLTADEEEVDRQTAQLRFDIGLLAERLAAASRWLTGQQETAALPVGYFGASTGGAAALVAAAELPNVARAVVSRGGRPDLAVPPLPACRHPRC